MGDEEQDEMSDGADGRGAANTEGDRGEAPPGEALLVLPSLNDEPTDVLLRKLAAAMQERYPGRLFVRQGVLLERGPTGGLGPVTADRLSALLQRAAQVRKETDDGLCFKPIPKKYAAWLRADPESAFRALRGLRGAPYLSRRGEIVASGGYHEDEQIWLDLPPATAGDERASGTAERGAKVIRAMLSSESKAVTLSMVGMLAALVETVVRPALTEPSPLYLFFAEDSAWAARMLARAAASFVLGRPFTDRGRPDNEAALPIFAAAAATADDACVLLEALPPDWDLNGIDLGRVLDSTGPVNLRGRGRAHPMLYQPGPTTWIAWKHRHKPGRGRRVVVVECAAGEPSRHAARQLQSERGAVVAALVASTQRWLEAGKPRPRTRLTGYAGWSAMVGGVVGQVLEDLDLGGMGIAEAWLQGLSSYGAAETDPWAVLAKVWPRDQQGEYRALSATEVVELARGSAARAIVPRAPGGTPQATAVAMGKVLADRVERGDVVDGLIPKQRKERNGQRYFWAKAAEDR